MVQRMTDTGPSRITAPDLAAEVGVAQSTLWRWVREARTVSLMSGTGGKPEKGSKSPRQWTPEEKVQVVMEAMKVAEEDLGEFLRSKGLHSVELENWRKLVMEAAQSAFSNPKKAKRHGASPDAKKIKALEKKIRRKDKALAEAAALLVLQKKSKRSGGTRTATHPRAARPDFRIGHRSHQQRCPAAQGVWDPWRRFKDTTTLEAAGHR